MILFRTEASPALGYGRLIRDLNLALQLKSKHSPHFLLNEDAIAAKLLDSYRIPRQWVKKAADNTQEALDLLIIDTAEPGPAETKRIEDCRRLHRPVIQFKELSSEPSLGDSIFDLSLPPLSTPTDPLFTGLKWAILHPRFRHFHRVKRKYGKRLRSILLFLGGMPDYHQVRDLIDMLCRHAFQVKVAADFLLKKSQRKVLRRLHPSLRIVGKSECLARAFFEADAAILTPGSVALESACCGTPAIYLPRNLQQKETAAWLQEKGTGISLGPLTEVCKESLITTLKKLDADRREEMGHAGKTLVDGRGIFSLLEFLTEKKAI